MASHLYLAHKIYSCICYHWLCLVQSTSQENRLAWVSALRRESFAGKGLCWHSSLCLLVESQISRPNHLVKFTLLKKVSLPPILVVMTLKVTLLDHIGRQARDKLLSAVECMSSQLPSLAIQVLDHKGVHRLENNRISAIASQLGINRTASRELLNATNWDMDAAPSLIQETSSVGSLNGNIGYDELVNFAHAAIRTQNKMMRRCRHLSVVYAWIRMLS